MPSETPLRVLLVNYEYPPLGGGGGVFTRDLAEAMAQRLSVTVLTTSDERGAARESTEHGVRVVRVPVLGRDSRSTASMLSLLSFFPSSVRHGRRLLERSEFDVVHSFFAVPSGCSGLFLARSAGVPHILSILGGDIYDPTKKLSPHRTPLLYRTVKELLHRSDKVVALSRDISRRARELYGFSEEMRLIPLGIPKPRFSQRGREELGYSPDDIVLVTVGRLVARKGIRQLLELLSRSWVDPRIKLVVVGDGPLRSSLEKRAEQLEIASRVCFLGYVSDEEKWQLLRTADVYISSALHEGFGIVFLEAMEAGLPIVCYDEGGQVDFLEDGVTSFLVPLGDGSTFATRVKTLCEDAELRKRLGAAAKHAAGRYHISTCVEAYLEVYAEAVARHRSGIRGHARSP